MGDRGNIIIRYSNGKDIYFYTHWRGSEMRGILASALARGTDRWSDESYLARIIFCELVKGQEMDTTGFGIAPYEIDNEHQHLIVDCKRNIVIIDGENRMDDDPDPGEYEFAKFVLKFYERD